MDIPLKSKPKVSTVNLLADSKFEIGSTTNSSAPLDIDNNDKDEPSQLNPNYLKIRHSSKNQQQEQQQLEGFPPNYTFSRRYSETEKNNFDPETDIEYLLMVKSDLIKLSTNTWVQEIHLLISMILIIPVK